MNKAYTMYLVRNPKTNKECTYAWEDGAWIRRGELGPVGEVPIDGSIAGTLIEKILQGHRNLGHEVIGVA